MLNLWAYNSGNTLSFRESAYDLDLSAKSEYPAVDSTLSLADLQLMQLEVERTT
jgi:hypothetical protein